MDTMRDICKKFFDDEKKYEFGGGQKQIDKLHAKGRLFAREPIQKVLDPDTFVELDRYVEHNCHNFGMDKKEYGSSFFATTIFLCREGCKKVIHPFFGLGFDLGIDRICVVHKDRFTMIFGESNQVSKLKIKAFHQDVQVLVFVSNEI